MISGICKNKQTVINTPAQTKTLPSWLETWIHFILLSFLGRRWIKYTTEVAHARSGDAPADCGVGAPPPAPRRRPGIAGPSTRCVLPSPSPPVTRFCLRLCVCVSVRVCGSECVCCCFTSHLRGGPRGSRPSRLTRLTQHEAPEAPPHPRRWPGAPFSVAPPLLPPTVARRQGRPELRRHPPAPAPCGLVTDPPPWLLYL